MVWGGPKRRMTGVFSFLVVAALILFLGGVKPSAALIAGAAFVYSFCGPFIGSCGQAIWQVKIAPEIQGRVFAIRRMVGGASVPVAYLIAGSLAEYVFEPLLAADGALAGSVGRVIGVGPGRGIGFLFMVLGILMLTAIAAGFAHRPLRRLEVELPDVVGDEPPSPAPG